MAETRADDAPQARVTEWIEGNIGPVRSIVREGRWRPAWYVEAESEGQPLALYVRGGRGARFPPLPLSYEAKVQALFAQSGVRVSRLYGFIDDLPAIVMERLPGRADIATAASDDDRAALRAQLAEQMCRIHAVDPARVASFGAPTADDPREVSLLHYRAIEKLYLEGDRLPSPDIEFFRGWIDRNAPACSEGAAVIAVDAGQFMFEGREITGMVDLEHVCIGDRHVDLAALRTRDRLEEIGDLESFYDLYAQRAEFTPDRSRIAFHWVTFAMIVPMQIAHQLAHPEEGTNYNEYVGWHVRTMDDAIKDVAGIAGIALEPYVLPEAAPDRMSFQLEALAGVIEGLPAADAYQTYRRRDLAVSTRILCENAARRSVTEPEYLDDIEALIGRRPADGWAADVALTEFVRTAGPELDAAILKLLYRRNERSFQIIRAQDVRERAGREYD